MAASARCEVGRAARGRASKGDLHIALLLLRISPRHLTRQQGATQASFDGGGGGGGATHHNSSAAAAPQPAAPAAAAPQSLSP